MKWLLAIFLLLFTGNTLNAQVPPPTFTPDFYLTPWGITHVQSLPPRDRITTLCVVATSQPLQFHVIELYIAEADFFVSNGGAIEWVLYNVINGVTDSGGNALYQDIIHTGGPNDPVEHKDVPGGYLIKGICYEIYDIDTPDETWSLIGEDEYIVQHPVT